MVNKLNTAVLPPAKKSPPKVSVSDPTKDKIKYAVSIMIKSQLEQYDKTLIRDTDQLRTYITNKLLEISQCGATKEELRALELLGKMSDVALFEEKSEIKITHVNSGALEDSIRERINKLLAKQKEEDEVEIEDAEYEECNKDDEDNQELK